MVCVIGFLRLRLAVLQSLGPHQLGDGTIVAKAISKLGAFKPRGGQAEASRRKEFERENEMWLGPDA